MVNTIVEMRIVFLEQFNYYIHNVIGDDFITEYWYVYGIPDGADAGDILEIASDDDIWLDVVKAFEKCCRKAGKI